MLGHIFLLFACLVTCGWMPDIVSFTLLSAGFLKIFYKYSWAVLGSLRITWSYLGKVNAFGSCFYYLLGGSGAELTLIIPHYRGKTFLRILPTPHEVWVFQSGWWEHTLLLVLYACFLHVLFPNFRTFPHVCAALALPRPPGGMSAALWICSV